MTDHPITPPPELVQRLRSEAPHGIRDAGVTRELHLIAAAYRAGADQELKVCCEYMKDERFHNLAKRLLATRRPEPSLKMRALNGLDKILSLVYSPDAVKGLQPEIDTLRQALESLSK